MGRPPCCDKIGIKKGPWTPEEDIILVSYIQEHGPGNWRSVPTNTGLLRCSKSCRLRWTNYLRPGIKRGNFTPHEEGMIIHLQALLGNKWAAIASYLPQRTDNDIKNYWNTHLKKKLKKFQSATDAHILADSSTTIQSQFVDESKTCSSNLISRFNHPSSSSYASSTENISRLLEGWMRSSPSSKYNPDRQDQKANENNSYYQNDDDHKITSDHHHQLHCYSRPKEEQEISGECDDDAHHHDLASDEFISILSFDQNLNGTHETWDKSTTGDNNSTTKGSEDSSAGNEEKMTEKKAKSENDNINNNNNNNKNNPPLSFLEKWLLDESSGHEEGIHQIMELSEIF